VRPADIALDDCNGGDAPAPQKLLMSASPGRGACLPRPLPRNPDCAKLWAKEAIGRMCHRLIEIDAAGAARKGCPCRNVWEKMTRLHIVA